jgi:hypothetical protein
VTGGISGHEQFGLATAVLLAGRGASSKGGSTDANGVPLSVGQLVIRIRYKNRPRRETEACCELCFSYFLGCRCAGCEW